MPAGFFVIFSYSFLIFYARHKYVNRLLNSMNILEFVLLFIRSLSKRYATPSISILNWIHHQTNYC